jgi:hypothetical protein
MLEIAMQFSASRFKRTAESVRRSTIARLDLAEELVGRRFWPPCFRSNAPHGISSAPTRIQDTNKRGYIDEYKIERNGKESTDISMSRGRKQSGRRSGVADELRDQKKTPEDTSRCD